MYIYIYIYIYIYTYKHIYTHIYVYINTAGDGHRLAREAAPAPFYAANSSVFVPEDSRTFSVVPKAGFKLG